jgi:hypothetical protein
VGTGSAGHLVDPAVALTKLERDLDAWAAQSALYRQRGWVLLGRRDLVVDVAFCAPVAVSSGPSPLPIVAACVRLDYQDYDLHPPSVEFIDLFTGEAASPHARALMPTADGPRDVLIENHPDTGRPFLCFPGVRQYHDHPQHSGDLWLLHRSQGAGSLATICDRVWRFMARNVLGLRVTAQMLPSPFLPQVDVRLGQGDVDGLLAQLSMATGQPVGVPADAATA